MNIIFQALWFFIPAFIANMAPVFVKKINFLNYPIDFEKTWNGKRLFGSHKTFRGFFFGTLFGAIFFEFQRMLFNLEIMKDFALINYSTAPFFLGALIAFSALLGDSVKSFFKRRFDIRPGKPWVPFDQLDFMIFAVGLTLPWSGLSILNALIVMGVVFILTMVVQYTGYLLKFKDDKL